MKMTTFLRQVVLVGLFVVPFIPLYVSSSLFFPFITGKNFAFRILVEILFGLWAILAIYSPSYRPKKSYLFYAILTFVGIVGLANLLGEFPYRSFWSNFERMDGYITLLHLAAYFLVLISVLKSKTEWFWYLNTSVLANFFILIYGFTQLAGRAAIHQGGVRLDASLGNAAYLATYLLFHIFILAYLLTRSSVRSWLVRSVYLILLFLNLVILYYTATRGAILGLIGGVLLTAMLVAWRGRGKERKIAAGALGVTIVFVGLFFLVRNTDFVKSSPVLSRFANISLTETTTQSRFLIWNMSWQGFKEKPILGWGQENYSLVFAKYYNPLMWRQEPWFDRSHNIFFDWLINAGILGLLSYLSVFGASLYYVWRVGTKKIEEKNNQKYKNARYSDAVGQSLLTGLLAAYLFQNIFVFDNLTSYLLFFTVLGLIHFRGVEEEEKEDKNTKKESKTKVQHSNTWKPVVAGVIAVLTVFTVYSLNVPQVRSSTALIRAISPQTSGRTANLEAFQQALGYDTFGSPEIREQMIRFALEAASDEKETITVKQNYVRLAIEEIQKQLNNFSQDVRANLYFGSFFSALGDYQKAEELLNKARELSPKKQGVLFELGNLYLRKGENAKAQAVFKEAYELAPEYDEARIMYGLVNLYSGNKQLANIIFEPINTVPSFYLDERILQAYASTGDQKKVGELLNNRVVYYTQMIKNNPTETGNYTALAEVYVRLNQKDKAVSILRQAASSTPSFSSQAEEYIKQISATK